MDIRNTKLEPGEFFHIFNRGINGAPVFFEEKNYSYFLKQLSKYTYPFVKTFAYCLLKNHYHILIQVREEAELDRAIKKNKENSYSWHVSNCFSSFLQSYTRGMNRVYDRTGALFEAPFKRIKVDSDSYFSSLIAYIHLNPEKHRIIRDFRNYPYSSYHTHLKESVTKLSRQEVLDWFHGKKEYEKFHLDQRTTPLMNRELVLE